MEIIKDVNNGITFLRIEEGGKEKLVLLNIVGNTVSTQVSTPVIRDIPPEIKIEREING